jgi:undecaprenyl-diphosphatase
VLKYMIDRPRPFEVGLTSAGVAANWSSFPSGHTLAFFTIVPMIIKKFPKLKTIFWIIAILVGFSRIYLGVHYTSDVVAGAFIGYGIGWAFMKIEERYRWSI